MAFSCGGVKYKALKANYCGLFGHYNPRSHTCLLNYERPLCIRCRQYKKVTFNDKR